MQRCDHRNRDQEIPTQGCLLIVGTGPGSTDHITPAALEAVNRADTVIGYKTYLDLIPGLLSGKKVISSAMMQEVDRCGEAVTLAEAGEKVALVSGGDPGIYAMAGLVCEIIKTRDSQIDIEVIPGIAALNACAARLGAPLMHDFAAISLSDLLTPWPLIERRLRAAAEADFVIVLYNPKSKRRAEHLSRACRIIMESRDPKTPAGVVTAATRDNEKVETTTLEQLDKAEVNMQSCVIIGNSATYAWRNFMVTPRGYTGKYKL